MKEVLNTNTVQYLENHFYSSILFNELFRVLWIFVLIYFPKNLIFFLKWRWNFVLRGSDFAKRHNSLRPPICKVVFTSSRPKIKSTCPIAATTAALALFSPSWCSPQFSSSWPDSWATQSTPFGKTDPTRNQIQSKSVIDEFSMTSQNLPFCFDCLSSQL